MNELIDKYFAGEMTDREKKDLFDRIETDETLKKEFLRMQNVVALTGILSRQDDPEVSRKGKQHFAKLLFRKRLKRTITVSLKYAAVFAVLIAGTFYVTKQYLSEEFGKNYTMITAPKGQRVKVDLPDGTVAWLSPCSSLRLSASFNESDRKVELDGATYFDVAKNPEKPFIVSAKGYRVRVLGTKFNISAYKNSAEFETDLVEGCVHIYDPADIRNEVFLQSKEKAVLWGDRLMKRESDFDNEEYLKNGIVSFLSEPFGRVLNSVALWNDVNFKIERSVNATQRISGKFRQSDSLESILKALQGAMPFKYKIVSEEEIIIY
ncbi:FecR family protein [Bacteroides fragilis]|uniref:FecR family protein n=1 Tax=Bacteroides TaxID=816 RepID=UPI001C733997|nr:MULTISPECIES: FecR family protein [Bacteroides]MCM0232369.1 FecR family protein [Bacteroides fragilis]MCZ2615521.1 FecR family protein [Bacteroides fragilis]MCZ2625638.1 FecR family protein [Bacteroides fragilis]